MERRWPQGVAVQPGTPATAHVLVSDEFEWQELTQNPRDYVGDWPKMNPARLVTVRTVDRAGEPIPYCQIWYSFTSGDFSERYGTDQQGYTYRDDIVGTFSVSATQYSFDPVTLSERYHYQRLTQLHDPADRPVIQIVFDPFPSGTGSVAGRVHDQFGRPLTEFHLSLSQGVDGPPTSRQRIPIIDPAGRFEVRGLAPSDYTITASAFDYFTHVYQRENERQRFTIRQAPNDMTLADIALEARQLRYGRARYDDGAPVQSGIWSGPTGAYRIDSDGTFRVGMSRKELERLASLENGKIQVRAYGEKDTQGAAVPVAWDDLSEDAKQLFEVVLPRPTPPSGEQVAPRAADLPDDPAAIQRLKQLGANIKTRDDGSVQEISFLDARIDDSDAIFLEKIPSIEKLRFDRTEIGDAMLTHVKELPNLRELELPNAHITDWGIEQLRGMSSLHLLNLTQTGITDTGLAALDGLGQLEVLDLTATKITDAGMQHVAQLTNLKRLFLATTAVTDSGLPHLAQLRTLEELNLSGSPITDDGLRQLADLTQLKGLSLSGGRVTDAGLEHLVGMKRLNNLNLSRTSISDLGVATIATFSQLERLYLSETRVTDKCLEKLIALVNLRVLYIEPNITDAALHHLSAFPRLEVLGIGGPAITDKGVEKIAKLSGLTNLFLDESNITDASIPQLIQLRKLYFLTLRGTKITPEGMQKFYDSYSRPPQVFGPQ
jgi:Leucine-rich repeat (LRR) protein